MSKYTAQTAWKSQNITRVVLNLNHNTDADILDNLSQVESKQGYIKELIRDDMKRHKKQFDGSTVAEVLKQW